jgi:voltage-gated potassium channel
VAGIALLGTVTATLASWLVDQVRAEEEREVSDLRTEIEVLNLKNDQLLGTKTTNGLADAEP